MGEHPHPPNLQTSKVITIQFSVPEYVKLECQEGYKLKWESHLSIKFLQSSQKPRLNISDGELISNGGGIQDTYYSSGEVF